MYDVLEYLSFDPVCTRPFLGDLGNSHDKHINIDVENKPMHIGLSRYSLLLDNAEVGKFQSQTHPMDFCFLIALLAM